MSYAPSIQRNEANTQGPTATQQVNPAVPRGGQYDTTTNLQAQYQQSAPPYGTTHGIGTSAPPAGQQSHYGEGGTGQYDSTTNPQAQYQQSVPPNGKTHGIGASAAPVGQQSHYGEGGTGQYDTTTNPQAQYQQSVPLDGKTHGLGASGAPVGQQSHYGEGGTTTGCNCGRPRGVCTCMPSNQTSTVNGGTVRATPGYTPTGRPYVRPSRVEEITGRLEQAAGVLIGNEALREKGIRRQQGGSTTLQNEALAQAQALEQAALQHRDNAVRAGAHPQNQHLGGRS